MQTTAQKMLPQPRAAALEMHVRVKPSLPSWTACQSGRTQKRPVEHSTEDCTGQFHYCTLATASAKQRYEKTAHLLLAQVGQSLRFFGSQDVNSFADCLRFFCANL
mmetsp:Transcript_19925/g.50821  ORF Transcript_19925/g.50821 Transcript_19925/m.50821 type:complete len:106 (-) Transcript_19925:1126-1443(-)